MATENIVILGARAPVALDLARSFQNAGHRIQLADSVPSFAAAWSKTGGREMLRLPPARFRFDHYCAEIAALADRCHLLIPTCEEVFYLASAAEKYGVMQKVFAPPIALLRQLHSKISFPALAKSLGIDAPETWPVSNAEELSNLVVRDGQFVLKPEFSRFGTATLIRPNTRELSRVIASPLSRWAAQSFVAGEEICVWTAAREGRIVASAAYRPRWRHGQAAAYAFESVDVPNALKVAEIIAAKLGVTGQLSFDIIMTPEGRAVPIECNPRATSGVHLFGGDRALARALLGEGPPVQAPAGLYYLSPAMLFLGLPMAIRSGSLAKWRHDIRSGNDALTRPGDRWPAIGAIADAARFAMLGLSRSNSPTQQTTDDIEWNGDELI
jgi:hypothetical protein